jgi:hypothetical protein
LILFFITADNQFGFKKGLSCSHAVFSVRNIIDRFVNGGSTVNLCAIDLSKAFDKVNLHALYIKLMRRHIPVELLETLEQWLNNCWTCVKWKAVLSCFFKINFGVRQGSVLSPHLFAIYLDGIVDRLSFKHNFFVVLYADDILLVAPSICELQRLLFVCESELNWLDMLINVKKSCCMRIGPRHDNKCDNIVTTSGHALPWVDEIRYLGIFIVRSRHFKCSLDHAKRGFYRSMNAILGKVGRVASEEVVLQLVASKCISVLLYGLEACSVNKTDKASLDFSVSRFLMKLFNTNNVAIIRDCQVFFGFTSPSDILSVRTRKFIERCITCDNSVCKFAMNVSNVC